MNTETLGPCYFVIFGSTGDLSMRKLLPALYHLEVAGRFNEDLRFIAFARRQWDRGEWLSHMYQALKERLGEAIQDDVYARFAARFDFVQGDLHDELAYQRLMDEISKPRVGSCENIIFYLAIRPADFAEVIRKLDRAGFNAAHARHRIVVEKPFGDNLESARVLNAQLHRHFSEEQVYRIDHYLGKETVQNLLVFRFANTLIEPIWNRHYIDHVQITVAEDLGIGSRAGYFDRIGTLRDMLQNHLLQLLTVVAMEPPAVLEADALRDEKVKVLRSIRPISNETVSHYALRAQYGAGSIQGEPVAGYLEAPGVRSDSVTETYVAIKLYIDNWRWRGVPFYIRTGKRLNRKLSLVAIRFRHPPQQLFRETPVENIEPNWISLSIQPKECMQMEVHAKQPGLGMNTRVVRLSTAYRHDHELPLDAYQTLLLDVIEGDRSLFIRFDEVEWAWRVVDPILRHWQARRSPILNYAAGSWGPDEADRLFDSEEHRWRNHA